MLTKQYLSTTIKLACQELNLLCRPIHIDTSEEAINSRRAVLLSLMLRHFTWPPPFGYVPPWHPVQCVRHALQTGHVHHHHRINT